MNSSRDLGEKIEKVVRELMDAHIEDTRAAVMAAYPVKQPRRDDVAVVV